MIDSDGDEVTLVQVSDLMSRNVVSLDQDTTLQEAIQTMVCRGIRHLPVVQLGKPVAVLSDRDVRMKVSDLVDPTERRLYLEKTTVMVHATKPATTTTPDTPLRVAAQLFVDSRIGCLPVVDADGRLVGILTQSDLLKWVAHICS